MSRDIEKNPRPGGPVKNWELFEVKVDAEGRQVTFRDPEGNIWGLRPGEELVFVNNEATGDRDPVIQRPFDDWKADYRNPIE